MFPRIPHIVVACLLSMVSVATLAWDHPGHMTTAAIAFAEVEKARPELIDKLGLLFLTHPDPAPFWVVAGEAKGKERVRRMFLEYARWADDSKFTSNDRLTWHTARWAIVAENAPPKVRAAAEARNGKPAGQALEAAELNFAMLSNHESTPANSAKNTLDPPSPNSRPTWLPLRVSLSGGQGRVTRSHSTGLTTSIPCVT